MPHIHTKSFTAPQLPAEADGVTFHKIFKNDYATPDYIVDTTIDNKKFFTWVKPSDGGFLIKAEKATRPSPNYYLQMAINAFAKLSNVTIEHTNIPEVIKKNVHLEAASDSALKTIDYFLGDFSQGREIAIEVGFGSGRHLIYQALQNPDVLYVGIEIHKPSIEQVIKQIAIQKIENLLLLDYDARIFLEFVPSNSVKQIFVHFPVPWDKKPSRRVISHSFIEESVRVLKPEGTLELRTDSENYFAYSLSTFLDARQTQITVKKNLDAPITSKYEDRWRKMEKNIYDIHMLGRETSPELEPLEQFEFEPMQLDTKHVVSLIGSTLKTDIGFIHFERIYYNEQNRERDYVIRLSLGSFERPEHLYLRIEEERLEYFPNKPVASKTNAFMHKELLKALNG